MIIGTGIDVVDVARFEATLAATPALLERLFTASERTLSVRSLAARFAAKEAVAKALRSPGDLSWQDAEVVRAADGAPELRVRGSVAARAAGLGVTDWHVSLSHDGGVATAVVIAERRTS